MKPGNSDAAVDTRDEELEILTAEGQLKQSFFRSLVGTTGKVAVIAFPILVTNAATTTNNFVGASIASSIDNQALSSAASAIIFPVQVSLIVIVSAPLFAIPVIMQQYIVSNNNKLVGQTIMQGMKLSLLLSLLPSALSYFSGDFFSLFGTPNNVVDLVKNYFDVFCYVLPTQLLAFSMQQAAIGLGKTKLLIAGSVLNTTSTLAFGYICAKGSFGLFNPSNSGVAYGFLAGGVLRILFYGIAFSCSDSFKDYCIFTLDNFRENKILKDIWFMGWPFGLQLISELGAINVLSVIADDLPNKVYSLDILNVMNQYNLFSVIIPIGLSEASAVLISKALQRKAYRDVRLLGNNVLFLGLVYNLALVALGLALPDQLASLFIDPNIASGNSLSENLRALFFIVFLGLTLNSGKDIVTGALRPLGIVKAPMYASYTSIWLFGLPIAYCLAVPLELGVAGVLLGYYLGTSAGTAFMLGKWASNSQTNTVKSIVEADPNQNAATQPGCLTRIGFFLRNCGGQDKAADRPLLTDGHGARQSPLV